MSPGRVRSAALLAALAADEDRIVFDLTGIEDRYETLRRELPGVLVRFAMKACPVDEVLGRLAAKGAGVDGASPNELEQALRAGVPVDRMHYGNTVKSDRDIADAHRLGVRDFATDSLEDVAAIAAHAPGARVFCRLTTSGEGALWGLSNKFGCSPADAVRVLEAARAQGLTPSGLSVHVGSQQMTADAWHSAVESLADVLTALGRRGMTLDHVNLGGGLPALGYLDRFGMPLDPPMDKIFAVIREGMRYLRGVHGDHLQFVMEPGRHLVADHGAIRAHVARLSERRRTGRRAAALALPELRQVQRPLRDGRAAVPARVPHAPRRRVRSRRRGGSHLRQRRRLPPRTRRSRPGTQGPGVGGSGLGDVQRCLRDQLHDPGFNGFDPLPYTWTRAGRP
jgi:ornithine decarboxylase